MRIDSVSFPDRLEDIKRHLEERFKAGLPFPGVGTWAGAWLVRIIAFRWNEARQVGRLKVERVNVNGQTHVTWCQSLRVRALRSA